MKFAVIIAVAIVALGGYAISRLLPDGRQASQNSTEPSSASAGNRVFCDRLAISPERRKLHHDLTMLLISTTLGFREVTNGFEFEFPGDPAMYKTLTEWIPDERACCPFFDITLRLEHDHGKVWLGITTRQGIKQFITSEFAAWFRGSHPTDGERQ